MLFPISMKAAKAEAENEKLADQSGGVGAWRRGVMTHLMAASAA